MLRRCLRIAVAIGGVSLLTVPVLAANQVTVESRSIGTNATDCPIRIRIDNDVALMAFVIPLTIREVTPGAYITELRLHWDDRLPIGGPLNDLRATHIYPDPDGTCSPNGFHTIGSQDTLSHPVAASPEGVLFAGIRFIAGDLNPGSDVLGSLVMDVSTTGTPGTFEIDTVCIDPANNLVYNTTPAGDILTPGFTKGTITITQNAPPVALCTDVTVSSQSNCMADASIDAGSFDPDGDALTMWQVPAGPYPIGQTAVKLYVRDANCSIDSCEAIVTVEDTQPPVITCPRDTLIVIQLSEGGAIVEYNVTATDDCSLASIQCSPPSGSFFPTGLSTVTCVAADSFGNWSQCQFHVAVLAEDSYCNDKGEDINCDGFIDATDMNHIIGVIFFNAPANGPCCYSNTSPE